MQPLYKGACVALASAFAALALNASPSHRFQVDAYQSAADVQPRLSYRIVAAPGMAPTDGVPFTDLAGYVRSALANKGMYEAPAGFRPELEIVVNLSVTERIEPAARAAIRFRPVTAHIRTINVSVVNEDGETVTEQQRVQVPSEYGRTDRRSIPTVVVREKSLVLCAREFRPTDATSSTPELWRVHVVGKDENPDARFNLQQMVTAAVDGVGFRDEKGNESAPAAESNRIMVAQKSGD